MIIKIKKRVNDNPLRGKVRTVKGNPPGGYIVNYKGEDIRVPFKDAKVLEVTEVEEIEVEDAET